MAKPPKLDRFVGTAHWLALGRHYQGCITCGIRRNGIELVLDLECESKVYTATLQQVRGDRFEGDWSRRVRQGAVTGVVTAVIYTSSEGGLLFGTWVEDATRYHWWAETTKIEHPPEGSATETA